MIEEVNEKSLLWYLDLLEDLLSFGREYMILHSKDIEKIIFLCLLEVMK